MLHLHWLLSLWVVCRFLLHCRLFDGHHNEWASSVSGGDRVRILQWILRLV